MADSLEITVVVENYIDIFLPATNVALYPVPGTGSRLVGEQGLSLWLDVLKGKERKRIIYDFGRSGWTFFHNLKLLGLDVAAADYLVLSHAHVDHFGALRQVLPKSRKGCTLVMHEAAAGRKKYIRLKDGSYIGPWEVRRTMLDAWKGRKKVFNTGAFAISPDVVLSGEIERLTAFEPGMAAACVKSGSQIVHDTIPEDQALYIDIEDKGIVVITGCCHAGLVNTVKKALELFPGKGIYGIVGGFHLNNAGDRQMEETIAYLAGLGFSYIAPLHCTGYHASRRLMAAFPGQWIPGTVGMRMTF
jgi:7,8-dihydropterin-6-yl-methyl-4-(beta-D-ribofuranosyl)aminobenzene 5'-phosphate synthase